MILHKQRSLRTKSYTAITLLGTRRAVTMGSSMNDSCAAQIEPLTELHFALAYEELKRVARRERRRAPSAETLDTTALVHETYLKIRLRADLRGRDAGYLLALAARAMRQILVDRARHRLAAKRNHGRDTIPLEGITLRTNQAPFDLVQVDNALCLLEAIDQRLARVVELHVFAGMAMPSVGAALGITERTAFRDWRKARAFLVQHLETANSDA